MLYIIRHGQTDRNKEKCLQGRSNLPLNGLGIQQAAAAGAFFRQSGIRFERVYSSPLVRATQTAMLAAGGAVPMYTDERLLEMDYGPYEGVSLEHPPQEILTFFQDFVHNPVPEGMEPLHAVVARTGALLEEIRDAGEKNILISTHAIAMKGILEYLSPDSHGAYWPKNIGNCAIYYCDYRDGHFTVPQELAMQEPSEK